MSRASSQKREQLKTAYKVNGKPAPGWVKKVDEMNDQEVIAVYMRLKNQNKI